MPMTTEQDGNIQAAKQHLSDAIRALIDPQPRTVYLDGGRTELTMLDSYYVQLRDSVAGQNVSDKGDSRQARLPIWCDAVDLLALIDATVGVWCRIAGVPTRYRLGDATAVTVGRLNDLDNATYRPQDTGRVNTWVSEVRGWVGRIKALLDPESVKHISAPCPACGKATVFRKDSSGEVVRQPALQLVTSQGCTCLACKTHWSPDLYMHLCRVLGFDLPDGVLE